MTYDVVVKGLLKSNEVYKAMPFLEEMCRRGFSADTTTISMLLDQVHGQEDDDILFEMIKKVVPKEFV